MSSRSWIGSKLERELSKSFHAKGIPMLVSPLLLRTRGCGQIDMARMVKGGNGVVIEVSEVKSRVNVGRLQISRLNDSVNFLSSIFGVPAILIYLFRKAS